MAGESSFNANAGFGVNKAALTFTIPDGGDGSGVDPVDLGRNYAFIIIACNDVANAAAGTDTITPYLSYDTDSPMFPLSPAYPTGLQEAQSLAATFWALYFVGSVRRVRIVASANASGGNIPFQIIGVDAAAQNA